MTETFPPERPFTRAELPLFGVTEHQLRRSLESGAVKQLIHGVLVPGGWPDTPIARARAAAVVLPAHCVLSDRSAAGVHGVDVTDYAELDLAPALEFVSVGSSNPTRRQGVLGGKRDLRPDEIMTIEGVRVTTPLRTACDVACLYGRRRALATLDAFRARHGLTTEMLETMLPRFAGRRGVTQLRELVPLALVGVDSPAESWIRMDICDEGLPMPAAQAWVWVPGWGKAKVENAWEHLRIAVEYDGEEFHSEEADRAHDDARRAALRTAGWIIIVVRRDGLSGPGRERWLAELRRAFESRAPGDPRRRRYARSPKSRPRRRAR